MDKDQKYKRHIEHRTQQLRGLKNAAVTANLAEPFVSKPGELGGQAPVTPAHPDPVPKPYGGLETPRAWATVENDNFGEFGGRGPFGKSVAKTNRARDGDYTSAVQIFV